jgi:hypothetical protein
VVNSYRFGGGDWVEEFPFDDQSTWTIASGGGGTMTVNASSNGLMQWNGVDQNFSGYASKLFSNGALSDTMFTMLADETIWTQVDGIPAPLFYGASNKNFDMVEGGTSALAFVGGLMVGCGGTNTGDHGSQRNPDTELVNYSTCWVGNGSGSDNWTTMFRTSATGARFINYPTSARSSSDYDATWTIASVTIGLDRVLCTGQNGGASGRKANGSCEKLTFKDAVNEE